MAAVMIKKDWTLVPRTRCEIYTRVMWYTRPVSFYNIWKKAEFYSRTYFTMEGTNASFTNKYCS